MCIATRLLSLLSNKKFAASKQQLWNNLDKGVDNQPRTVAGVLKHLKFHSVYANTLNASPTLSGNRGQFEAAFVTGGDQTPGEDKR